MSWTKLAATPFFVPQRESEKISTARSFNRLSSSLSSLREMPVNSPLRLVGLVVERSRAASRIAFLQHLGKQKTVQPHSQGGIQSTSRALQKLLKEFAQRGGLSVAPVRNARSEDLGGARGADLNCAKAAADRLQVARAALFGRLGLAPFLHAPADAAFAENRAAPRQAKPSSSGVQPLCAAVPQLALSKGRNGDAPSGHYWRTSEGAGAPRPSALSGISAAAAGCCFARYGWRLATRSWMPRIFSASRMGRCSCGVSATLNRRSRFSMLGTSCPLSHRLSKLWDGRSSTRFVKAICPRPRRRRIERIAHVKGVSWIS